jgi:O-antigen/teichoic acid export membrane protein
MDACGGLCDSALMAKHNLRAIMARGQHHLTLLANAGAMMSSTLVTAGLGFVYWWIAARFLTVDAVGLASAAVAAMSFLALVGDLGLGTLLIGQITRHPGRIGGLISAAFIAATLCSAALAVLCVLLAAALSPELVAFTGSLGGAALFTGGVALTGLVLVLDQTLLGILKAQWHIARNISFALVKLALLALVVWLGVGSAMTIYATWAAGNLVSLIVLCLIVVRSGGTVMRRPDFKLLSGMTGPIISHHALNVLSQAPGLLMPVLVTHLLSARINAAFYAAWLLIGVAYLAPASLTTALFSVAAHETRLLGQRLRFTLAMSMGLSGLTILGCIALGGFALSIFNPAYSDLARATLILLAATMPAVVIKYHYIALKRIREEMTSALPLLGLGAAAELGAAAAGGSSYGLSGLAAGWLIAVYAQAAFMLRPLLRAIIIEPEITAPATSSGLMEH